MRNAIQLTGDVQFRGQPPPVRARHNRRDKDIGRLETKVGLNTAHELTAIAQPVEGPLPR